MTNSTKAQYHILVLHHLPYCLSGQYCDMQLQFGNILKKCYYQCTCLVVKTNAAINSFEKVK